MSEKLLVPDIGDFENVEVIELLVKEGQKIIEESGLPIIKADTLLEACSKAVEQVK